MDSAIARGQKSLLFLVLHPALLHLLLWGEESHVTLGLSRLESRGRGKGEEILVAGEGEGWQACDFVSHKARGGKEGSGRTREGLLV